MSDRVDAAEQHAGDRARRHHESGLGTPEFARNLQSAIRNRAIFRDCISFSVTIAHDVRRLLPPFARTHSWVLLPYRSPAGVLGAWIILRGLAFYSHAVGTAAFRGLCWPTDRLCGAPGRVRRGRVLALACALLTRGRRLTPERRRSCWWVSRARGDPRQRRLRVRANVESLLFGSLLLVDGATSPRGRSGPHSAAGAAVGPRWLARGFDPGSAAHSAPGRARLQTRRCSPRSPSPQSPRCRGGCASWRPRCWWSPPRRRACGSTGSPVADGDRGPDRPGRRRRHLAVGRDRRPPGATIAVLAGGVSC